MEINEELLLEILELFTLEDTLNLGYFQIKKYFDIGSNDIKFNSGGFYIYLTNSEIDLLVEKLCKKNNKYTIKTSVLIERKRIRFISTNLEK